MTQTRLHERRNERRRPDRSNPTGRASSPCRQSSRCAASPRPASPPIPGPSARYEWLLGARLPDGSWPAGPKADLGGPGQAVAARTRIPTAPTRAGLPLGHDRRRRLPRLASPNAADPTPPASASTISSRRNPRRIDPRLGGLPTCRTRTCAGTGDLLRHLRSRLPPRPRFPMRCVARRPPRT